MPRPNRRLFTALLVFVPAASAFAPPETLRAEDRVTVRTAYYREVSNRIVQPMIQVTKDLPGFWRGSWKAVRADLRGRYPRHPWPENPLEAPPTTRAKPRGT